LALNKGCYYLMTRNIRTLAKKSLEVNKLFYHILVDNIAKILPCDKSLNFV